MTSKKNEQGRVTKQAIIEAAELVFYENGAAVTTLEDIAERAGVTRGAIYWHFKNKDELLEAVMDNTITLLRDELFQIIRDVADGGFEQLKQGCTEALQSIVHSPQKQRGLTIMLLKCEHTQETRHIFEKHAGYRREIIDALVVCLERLAANQTGMRLIKPAPMIAEALVAYHTGLLFEFLQRPDEMDLAATASDYTDILFNAILVPDQGSVTRKKTT